MAKIVMGYWDCSSCGKSVAGTIRSCPSCGHARGEDVKFYMKDIEYLSEEEAAKIGTKPDWLCEYCGTYNNDSLVNCQGCGAVRGNDNKDYFDNNKDVERNSEKDESKWECAYCGAQNPDSADHCGTCKAERCEKKKEEAPAPVKKKGSKWPLIILFGIIGIALLFVFLNKPKTKDATINSIAWEATQYVEGLVEVKNKTIHQSDIPSDAVVYDTAVETYTEYEKVGSHVETKYEDNGNGTFTEVEVTVDDYGDVEKTRTVYYYRYNDWRVTRNVANTGEGKNPTFKDVTLANDERLGSKKIVYTVNVTESDGTTAKYTTEDASIIDKLTVGKTAKIKVKDKKIVGVD